MVAQCENLTAGSGVVPEETTALPSPDPSLALETVASYQNQTMTDSRL